MATARAPYLVDKEVLIFGWMRKAPPDRKMRKKGGIAKVITYRWQRRFFVLFKPRGGLHDEYLLEYFTDESCTRRKGSVDLKNCTEIAAFDQSVPDKFALSLHTLDRNRNRIYYLSCTSEEEMNEWVTYLTNVCKMEIRSEDTPEPPAHDRVDYPTTVSSAHMSQWRYDGSTPSLSTPSSHPESPFFGGGDARHPQQTPPQLPPMRRRTEDSNGEPGRPVPAVRGRPLPPPTNDLNYDVLPHNTCDSGIYQVPPPGSEEYYNVTGGARPDSVYHYPADPYNRPVSGARPASHEYINLTQTGGGPDEDVYKVPPDRPPSPPPPQPPRIPPRTTLRYSLIRRQQQQQQQQQQQSQPRQASSIYNVPPPPPPPPASAQRGYPPASPTADQQHEYLNLWSAGPPGPGNTYSESTKPVSINDVPPIVPPLPQRLRKQNDKSSSTSSSISCSSSGSGSSRSSRISSSGQMAGAAVSGGQQQQTAVPSLNSMPDLPFSLNKCSLGDDNGGELTRPAHSPNSDGHVSYLCAEDIVFANAKSKNPNRPASLTEYNELDALKTKALAQLAQDMAKNNK